MYQYIRTNISNYIDEYTYVHTFIYTPVWALSSEQSDGRAVSARRIDGSNNQSNWNCSLKNLIKLKRFEMK